MEYPNRHLQFTLIPGEGMNLDLYRITFEVGRDENGPQSAQIAVFPGTNVPADARPATEAFASQTLNPSTIASTVTFDFSLVTAIDQGVTVRIYGWDNNWSWWGQMWVDDVAVYGAVPEPVIGALMLFGAAFALRAASRIRRGRPSTRHSDAS